MTRVDTMRMILNVCGWLEALCYGCAPIDYINPTHYYTTTAHMTKTLLHSCNACTN